MVYPLVPEEIVEFSRNKKAILVLEEGQPEFIEQEIASLQRAGFRPVRLGTRILRVETAVAALAGRLK